MLTRRPMPIIATNDSLPAFLRLTVAVMLAAFECRGATAATGVVQDVTGAVVPGAKVTLTLETAGHDSQAVVTNGSGVFSFVAVPPGEYNITVEAVGFRRERVSGLQIAAEGVAHYRQSLCPTGSCLDPGGAGGAHHPLGCGGFLPESNSSSPRMWWSASDELRQSNLCVPVCHSGSVSEVRPLEVHRARTDN
jgi:Carboxypeptidase regulatory-like domain